MKVRFQKKICRAKITKENPENVWEITAYNEDGTVAVAVRSRKEIIEAGMGLLQLTELEWEMLGRAGWLPPFDDEK